MAGEGQLELGGEDAQLAALGVVDEDRLAEAEIRCHGLARLGGKLRAVEEHREWIAGLAALVAEDPQDMQP
jgi:NAD(P)H-dependent flavin oxidoreductase YrpB (nitropropane dioxygenase family)